MPAIDRGMVLVAEGGNGDIALLRLSLSSALAFDSVRPVLLAQLGWLLLSLVRHLSCLDVGLFSIGIALLRRRHDRGIHDLPTHRQITGLGEVLVKRANRFFTARPA